MIDARYQRRGYGRAALASFVDGMREQGIKRLTLQYVPDPEGPHNFYLAFGFEDTGEAAASGERIMSLQL